ncbi:endonuclease VII domain-containing protein [Nocardia brasiliensis]|uniref:endonuclease VII domain-containing protein n=1 Tax=Nocardia brasiliensis TaxID=37326 RepID=UPI002454A425|nr:endonuclease VII domain-containing protein [Nocardia brasiliensis]
MHRYGITRDQYEQLYAQQGGICRICGHPPKGRPLVVDHCHLSDPVRVRALLCANCNAALGLLREDPAVMVRAAEYIGSQLAA